jgi:hypothetical protein
MSQQYSDNKNKKGQQNHAIISHSRRLLHIYLVHYASPEFPFGKGRGSSDGARGSNEGAGESREGAKGQIRL